MSGHTARRARLLLAALAACLVAAALGGAASAAAEEVGGVEHVPTHCWVGKLISGPGGDVWFSCVRAGVGRKSGPEVQVIGKATGAGKVREYGHGFPAATRIKDLAAGPEGDVWFTLVPNFQPQTKEEGRPAIGRITPSGKVTIFHAGLRPGARPGQIVAGPGGEMWFADGAEPEEVGRVTPRGKIAEYPIGLEEALSIGGFALGADGNLWFTQVAELPPNAKEKKALISRVEPDGKVAEFGSPPAAAGPPVLGSDGNVWFTEWAGSRIAIDRITPAGEITRFGEGAVGLPNDLVLGPDGNVWFTAQQSIGRVTPSGQVSRFSECMDYRYSFSEATSIVSGPGGDLWFTGVTSRETPSIGEPASIGRVTPSGQITQFKYGVEEARSILAGPDGRLWFAYGGREIERITPPTAPVNTFIFAGGHSTRAGAAQIGVEVPGPGSIELRPLAVRREGEPTVKLDAAATVDAVAPTCGIAPVGLQLGGPVLATFRRKHRLMLEVEATFTPTGGTPFTERHTVLIREH
jgi:streptogramin lyase